MDYRILGPLEAFDGERPLALGGARQRSVLALLLLHANEAVTRDVIVDEITVRQSIAPMLAVGGSLPLGARGYRAGLEATLASGKFHSRESGSDTDLGTIRTGKVVVSNKVALTLDTQEHGQQLPLVMPRNTVKSIELVSPD